MMELLTEWEIKGRAEGKRELVLRMLIRKCGPLPTELEEQVGVLSSEQLDALANALLEFTTLADLCAWLDAVPS